MSTKLLFPDTPVAPLPVGRYRVDWMGALSEKSLAALWKIGTRRTYRDNQVLQQRGDTADHALVLLSGRLRSEGYTASGAERMTRWLEAGEVSGFSSVLGNAPVPVDLVASGEVEVLILPQQALLDYLEHDASACLAVARMLSLRVNELFDVLFIDAEDTLSVRVWATLRRLAAENGQPTGTNIMLRISQADLARVVGASRQRVNAALRELQARQRIRLGYRWLEVLDTDPDRHS